MIAVFKRELRAFFFTPLGYMFLGLFLLVTGIFFTFGNILGRSSDFPNLVGSVQFLFLFGVPVLSMRLFAEENRQKTDQLLLTSPVSISSIVVGKYLAALVVFLVAVAVVALYALTIAIWGDLAVPQSLGAMTGFILAGAAYLAIGTLVSVATENQAIAAVATFAILLLLQLVEPIRSGLPREATSGMVFAALVALSVSYLLWNATGSLLVGILSLVVLGAASAVAGIMDTSFFPGLISQVLGLFALSSRQQRFTAGILSLEDVAYYLTFSFVMLFLCVRFIEKRRWA